MRSRKIKLQTQIIIFMSLIIFVVTGLSAGVYSLMEYYDSKESYHTLSKQTANSLSHMPSMGKALISGEIGEVEANVLRATHQAENPTITVMDRNGTMIVHPNATLIGSSYLVDKINHSLMFGAILTDQGEGTEGEEVIYTAAPIYSYTDNYEQLVGVVLVEYPLNQINKETMQKVGFVLGTALITLTLGGVGSIFLAQKIKKSTLGLEPSTISLLYRQKQAMLESIKEGIIAVDTSGNVTLINSSAKQLLGMKDQDKVNQLYIEKLGLTHVLEGKAFKQDRELIINNKVYIVNQLPLYEETEIIGAIASFRDKTEMIHLVETLSEVKQYSDDLRAHTHEYTNKLYVLMGLLELGEVKEAVAFIKEETTLHATMSNQIFQTISNTHLQAILLGKIARASEKKVTIEVDENSSIDKLPDHFSLTSMILIIGNLIDNAMEAVADQNDPLVSFFITDIGKDIVIEIKDNGPGFENKHFFEKGLSSKGENRGYGLSNVRQTLSQLEGSLEVHHPSEGGAIIVVYLPKRLKNKARR
ncbi:sensor histidine kinase [Alkalihalobacillus sp. FSL R5-0424]